ncbi:MAG: alpha/beta fold hydrolase [Dehalococcoidia bacterium]
MGDVQRVPTADGIEIAVETDGEGRPLVLVHGITEARALWEPVVGPLAERYRVIRVDLRGHGESSPATSGALAELAGDVAAVVAALGLERPALVGHSLGGAVVTALAGSIETGPVVNVDQPLRLAEFQAGLKQLEPMLRGEGFLEALDLMWQGLGGDRLSAELQETLRGYHHSARQELVLSIWADVLALSPAELDAMVDEILRGVRVPYLSLHGEAPPAGYAEWLTSRVPTAAVEVWPGHTHWPHLVAPGRFVERVLSFVG